MLKKTNLKTINIIHLDFQKTKLVDINVQLQFGIEREKGYFYE